MNSRATAHDTRQKFKWVLGKSMFRGHDHYGDESVNRRLKGGEAE
jgi:hypothetical protein